MPLNIVRNDITKMKVDAIVNAANTSLLGGGGVDGCIHRAAGKRLLEECKKLGGCDVGDAKLTKGYHLPSRYIIHTVGPVWKGGTEGEAALLESCYQRSLEIAKEHGFESLAFPLISSGAFGYPKSEALRIATETIGAFLLKHEMQVYLVVFDMDSYAISETKFADIQSYIDDRYVETHAILRSSRVRAKSKEIEEANRREVDAELNKDVREDVAVYAAAYAAEFSDSSKALNDLDARLREVDESFSQMLLRKIDEKGITDAECYKKANIDRKLFSKIRSDVHYKPKKTTVLAFAISLELPIEDTREMLQKAGFALSHSNKFDIIVEYFISKGNYDIFEINEALFAFDQSLLGAS